MDHEFNALLHKGTWELVPKSSHVPIGCKWVFRVKRKPDGTIDKYKARIVAKGFLQEPVPDVIILRPLVQFLNPSRSGSSCPPGYIHPQFPNHISDASLFLYDLNGITAYFLVYVNDIVLTGNNTKFLDEFVNNLSIKFSIKDLGTSHQFLGVEVISTPSRSIVGSLQYLAITRPDVSFAVNKLSQFMHAPTQLHLQALKRVLRYLKGTIHHGLFLNRKSAITLTAFSDSNWGGIKDNGRSTTAYILYLGSNIISWRSARQKSVSRSSTEAEYKALANASAEMMWVQNLLHELGISLHETPTLFCDNTGATYLCANPVYHSCMKHVAHFVRERVSEGSLRVLHISSKDQLVDMLTKPLGRS
ncbi:retrovirus-related pol polyprotein from transposon TNT 1-94 [Tanacetum coccineum]